MDESLKATLEAILKERSWSWTVIGIAYLITGLTVRGWFLRPLIRRSKELHRKVYRHLKGAYLQRSVWGWIFFMLSFVIVVMLWNVAATFPITLEEAEAALAALVSFILSIIFHLEAFGMAAVATLKQVTEKEKGL